MAHKIEYNGMVKSLADWARYYGIPMNVMHARHRYYKDDLAKLFQKYRPRVGKTIDLGGERIRGVANADKEYFYMGREQSLRKWSEELGIPIKCLEMRVRRDVRGDALFKPARSWIPKVA